MTGQASDMINGVPRDQWGLWCQHNKHIMVADPDDDSMFPRSLLADPWPCDICTPEVVLSEVREEYACYLMSDWAEWRDSQ